MTETECARAKEIYFKYCCNSFFLHREDDAEEYESYKASREQERQWREEFVEIWKTRLRGEAFLQALFCLRTASAGKALPEILAAAGDAADGYAKLKFADAIWELASSLEAAPPLRERAARKASELWRELLEQPFDISDTHRRIIAHSLAAFGAATEEEYVKKYARNMLRHTK